MATVYPTMPPSWPRPIAIVAVLWNAFGVFMYLSSVGVFGDPTIGMSEADRAAAASIPASIVAAFAVGTFAGLGGSIGLVLRRGWSVPVLILSLVALLVLEGWSVFLSDHREAFGIGVPVMVTAGAILLAGLAGHARNRGWLG